MATEITRQICASVYQDLTLAEKFIKLVKSPYNAIVQPPGVDPVLVLKHALNARQQQRRYYIMLSIPAIVFWLTILRSPLIALVCLLTILGIVIYRDVINRQMIRNNFMAGNFNPNFSYTGPGQELIAEMQQRTTKNVVYYSGYSPFVGCGYEIGGWSFVVDIDKGKTEMGGTATPKPFLEEELYYIVAKDLMTLQIENFSIENKVYFNGKKIRDNRGLLPDIFTHPVTEVNGEFMKAAMNSGIEHGRFYKMIQVMGWSGDLILTAFLRCQRGEKTLFVESNYYLLPPIQDSHRAVDRIRKQSGIRHFITRVLRLMMAALFQSFASIIVVAGYIMAGLEEALGYGPAGSLKKQVRDSPDYDYGAQTSIREMVSQGNYFQHFQKLDKERYLKIIDKRIFNALANFLESKGISTSEFRERETAILNNGIIVNSGGSLSGGNIAAGVGAAISNIAGKMNPNKSAVTAPK